MSPRMIRVISTASGAAILGGIMGSFVPSPTIIGAVLGAVIGGMFSASNILERKDDEICLGDDKNCL